MAAKLLLHRLFLALFIVNATTLFAQTIEDQKIPLYSRTTGPPIIPLVKFIQPEPVSPKDNELKKVEKKKTQPITFIFIDFPFFSDRETIDLQRIKKRNLNIGSILNPWEQDVRFDLRPIPRLELVTQDLNVTLNTNLDQYRESDITRHVKYARLSVESNIWAVAFGGESFIFREDVSNVLSVYKFKGDFYRYSYGGQGFWGLKFGNYVSNFISANYGVGYVLTNGQEIYHSPTLRKKEILPLYKEEFRTRGFSLAGKLRVNPISAKLDVEKTWYYRVLASPDPLRFGLNRFEDLVARGTLEVSLLPKHDQIRLVAEMTKYLGSKERLLFKNNDPEFQLFLRIAFH